jgi:ATP/maltotriose-dependent transcriptional regulator MalT/DNA-binding SARP family transcriptional activator
MQASAASPIDTRTIDFLSYAPSLREQRLGMEEIRVAVEPETGDHVAEGRILARPCFPLRHGKIQRPILPEETLRRDRLLDWFKARADRRLLYVTAEAGFGKTTLVADYLRLSRMRTFWYRLDEEDTDGLVFLRYLIATCQSVDKKLLARSAAALEEVSLQPVSERAILETVLAEIEALGDVPSALVLDDFHMVESLPSIGEVVERLIDRFPEGLKVIIASRRTPSLAVAGLKAHGGLAELGREDLRFDEAETDRLFRDAYRHPLEPDVLHDLQLRTDGWAASLQLVKTAVEGRTPGQVRAFVDGLSGADGDLYDYLAEEVVGDLAPELRDFLVRTSILEEIEPETAAVASGASSAQCRNYLAGAVRLGLVSRSGERKSTWRAHHLVREFLLSHLEAEFGEAGIAEMHRRVAAVMEPRSWRLAARHWSAARDAADVRRVVSAATPSIIGTGDLAAAEELIDLYPDPEPNAWFDIIRARRMYARCRSDEALVHARGLRAVCDGATTDSTLRATAALTVLTVATECGDRELRDAGMNGLADCTDHESASIARAIGAIYDATGAGSLDALRRILLETIQLNRERSHTRFEAISFLNLANMENAAGHPEAAIAAGTHALTNLNPSDDCGDFCGATLNVARGLAQLGRWDEARAKMAAILAYPEDAAPFEVSGEIAELEAMYGDPARGIAVLGRSFSETQRRIGDSLCRVSAARLALEQGVPGHALELLEQVGDMAWAPGLRSSILSLDLLIKSMANPNDSELPAAFEAGIRFASDQQAWYWWKTMRLTQTLVSPTEVLIAAIRALPPEDAGYLSPQAELVLRRLGDLDKTGFDMVVAEATLRPERWRWAIRNFLSGDGQRLPDIRRAAELLELVGDETDLARLRALRKTRALRLADAGRTLCRRLAPRLYVDDLDMVRLRIGDRTVLGSEIRKKVLSLLCFLLTRPQFTATREQILEALWPEMDPNGGANSLNQSAYFLRKVLEPGYQDETSAGYLQSKADLVWLDRDLVTSRSVECLNLLATIRRDSSPDLISKLAETYTGKFGGDFIYDDWASAFRDTLHARYLDRVERAVNADTQAGYFDRALSIAQQALQADPDAEQIELCLLRLYRRTGANAAAAEQYAHYAGVLRNQLGVDPPPLESI